MEEKGSGATEDRRGPSRADAGGDTHTRPGGLGTSHRTQAVQTMFEFRKKQAVSNPKKLLKDLKSLARKTVAKK